MAGCGRCTKGLFARSLKSGRSTRWLSSWQTSVKRVAQGECRSHMPAILTHLRSILNAGFSKTDQPTFAGMHMLHDPLRIRDQLTAHTGSAPLDSVAEDEPLDANATYEILLSGSGHSAWGQFVLHGRIRSACATPSQRIALIGMQNVGWPVHLGEGVYAVNGGSTLVGRWRDTFTQPEVPGYEVRLRLNGQALVLICRTGQLRHVETCS
jgi:hypothetical protein